MEAKLNKEINVNLQVLKYQVFNEVKKENKEPIGYSGLTRVCQIGELYSPPNSCASYHSYDNVNHVNHAPMYPRCNVYDCYSPTNNYAMQGVSGGQGGAGSISGSGGNIIYCGAAYQGIGAISENSPETEEEQRRIIPVRTNGFRGIIEEDMLKGTCVEISIKHLRE